MGDLEKGSGHAGTWSVNLAAHFGHSRGAGSWGRQHQGCRQHHSSALPMAGEAGGDGNTPVQTPSTGDGEAAMSLADTEQCL